MELAELSSALEMGLICGLIGGAIGALVGAIRWFAMGGRKRGQASDYVGWMKQAKAAKEEQENRK